jgi:hypothetical protein
VKFNRAIFILLSTFALNAFSATQDEIKYLLAFVDNSACNYERNGTMYTGAEAAKHINKKYRYYFDDIKSTEDFIKYSATRSKISGKYYKVHCANKIEVKSRDWLLLELKNYRKSNV